VQEFLQQLANGIAWGSIYALIALGYTLVYGILRLINFAHGDVYMVGAFAAYYLARLAGVREGVATAPVVALLVMIGAMATCALLGIVIERAAYRPVRRTSSSRTQASGSSGRIPSSFHRSLPRGHSTCCPAWSSRITRSWCSWYRSHSWSD
jgi:branched-subunit amino acid ABC-type transport system permease component